MTTTEEMPVSGQERHGSVYLEYLESLRSEAQAQLRQWQPIGEMKVRPKMEWQPIETAPKDEDILVSYLDNGKRQIAIARYQTDMYDGQEGWYEQIKNYTDYQGVRMHHQLPDGMSLPIEIDFWMPLPEFPNSPQASVEPHWQAQPASMPHAAPVDAQDGGDYCERLRRVIHDALTSGKPRYNYLGAVGCTTGKIGLPQHRTINKETTP